MSLWFLIGFVMSLFGKIPKEEMTDEYFIIWALFSIADALWMKGR
jgi:hypothetical protein